MSESRHKLIGKLTQTIVENYPENIESLSTIALFTIAGQLADIHDRLKEIRNLIEEHVDLAEDRDDEG